jgi:hypothetical protein
VHTVESPRNSLALSGTKIVSTGPAPNGNIVNPKNSNAIPKLGE